VVADFVLYEAMRNTRRSKSRQRSEEEVLAQGIQQLLRAAKEQAKRRGKLLSRDQLRKEGYSDRFVDQVARA
jgi:hypothetical protein